MLDRSGVYDLQAIVDQNEINLEMAWANYLEAQERADDGNQITGS